MRGWWWLGMSLAALLVLRPPWPRGAGNARARAGEQCYASFVRALERERLGEPSPAPSPLAAALEEAHAARRRGALEEALEGYEALAWSVADARTRTRAEHWRARTLELSGRANDARRAWTILAEHARDPCERLRAWDHVAITLAGEGALDEALHALRRCLEVCAPRADEASEQGARVARALASMRAPRVLGLVAWPANVDLGRASSAPSASEKSFTPEVDCSQAPLR